MYLLSLSLIIFKCFAFGRFVIYKSPSGVLYFCHFGSRHFGSIHFGSRSFGPRNVGSWLARDLVFRFRSADLLFKASGARRPCRFVCWRRGSASGIVVSPVQLFSRRVVVRVLYFVWGRLPCVVASDIVASPRNTWVWLSVLRVSTWRPLCIFGGCGPPLGRGVW